MKDSICSDEARSVEIIAACIEGSDSAYYSERRRTHRLELRKNSEIAYLKEGVVSVHRQEDGLVTLTIKAPAIIGLAQMRGVRASHFFRCSTDCSMWFVNIEKATELFDSKKLWRHAFDLLTAHIHLYFTRENVFHKQSIKDMVAEHLRLLWLSDESERNCSIYSYILNRSNISRSAIHKAVAELVRDGWACVHRGKLVMFNCEGASERNN